jgi:hypothetical protein
LDAVLVVCLEIPVLTSQERMSLISRTVVQAQPSLVLAVGVDVVSGGSSEADVEAPVRRGFTMTKLLNDGKYVVMIVCTAVLAMAKLWVAQRVGNDDTISRQDY